MFIICRISLLWASSKSWRCFRVILLLTYKSFQQHERQDTKSCQVTQMSKQCFTFLDRYAICWTLTRSKFFKYVRRSKSQLKLLMVWIKVPAWESGVNLIDESSCHVLNSWNFSAFLEPMPDTCKNNTNLWTTVRVDVTYVTFLLSQACSFDELRFGSLQSFSEVDVVGVVVFCSPLSTSPRYPPYFNSSVVWMNFEEVCSYSLAFPMLHHG